MAAHFMDYIVPGSGRDALFLVDQALAVARRRVLACNPPHGTGARLLRWQVREIRSGNLFLHVEESGPGSWDPVFARGLSRMAEGIVIARESHRHQERYGIATFLFGRTIDFAEKAPAAGTLLLGAVPREEAERPDFPDTLYQSRFADLCNSLVRFHEAPVLQRGSMQVTAPEAPFQAEQEEPVSWIYLPNVEAADWAPVARMLAPHWAWRAGHVRGTPFVELRISGDDAGEDVARISGHLGCSATLLSLKGGGASFQWAEAYDGSIEAQGYAQGARPLFDLLSRAATLIGEASGMIFGQGGSWQPPAVETKLRPVR
jgi:hypothetical protein